jgi:hypothetical protein
MSSLSSPRLAALMLIVVLTSSCGSSSAPAPASPSPVPSNPSVPAGPFADVSGKWSGTIESANATTRTMALNAVQSANCVDGTWTSADGDWRGAISGYADAVSYSGQMSIEFNSGNQHCAGVADVSGPVDSGTIRWTGSGFRLVGQCPVDLPQTIVVTLRRM